MTQPFEEFPLQSAVEASIIMHRDVHFGGNFNIMLKYYEEEGKGVCSEFGTDSIRKLAEFERRSEQNIAPIILTGADAEKVAEAKKAYKKLRDLFENDSKEAAFPRLIASLILAEEEDPQEEIQAIVQEKSAIVPALLDLLRAENYYDPLFPGYGLAPLLAAKCLSLIGDKRSIISLFESIGSGDFFYEDTILQALQTIGAPAKEFLLKVLHAHPIDGDNERAAIALVAFKDDEEVSEACFHLLEELQYNPQLPLTNYLILACSGLKNPEKRQKLINVANKKDTPRTITLDIQTLAKQWK
jgi:hypothetical protein